MYNKATIAVSAFITMLSPMVASADVFTDSASFGAANPGLTIIDFEGLAAPGTFTGNSNSFYGDLGVLFSTPNNAGSNTVVNGSGGDFNFPSSGITSNAFGAAIEMDFTGATTAVGFNVAVMDFSFFQPGSVMVEVFNGTALLATESFSTASFSDFTSFIGFSNMGSNITSIIATPVGTAFTQLAIDNLAFNSVPTPGALGILGLGLVFSGRRRS